jgi:heme/copper-type cytochrome/quinol oxidase subunit 2
MLTLSRFASPVVVLMIIVLMLAPYPAYAQGCSMCGTALQDPEDPLARSISASVLFMMSMPFVVFFSVAGWLVYRYRRFLATEPDPLAALHNPIASKEEPR